MEAELRTMRYMRRTRAQVQPAVNDMVNHLSGELRSRNKSTIECALAWAGVSSRVWTGVMLEHLGIRPEDVPDMPALAARFEELQYGLLGRMAEACREESCRG